MKRWITYLCTVAVLGWAAGAAFAGLEITEQSGIRTFSGPRWAAGEVLVKYNPGVKAEEIRSAHARAGVNVISHSRRGGFYRLALPEGVPVEQAVAAFSKNPNVEYAEPNYRIEALAAPNDTYYTYQWHLDNPVYGGIRMETAWDMAASASSQVRVAVIDTGVAYEDYGSFRQAPDLAGTPFLVLPESDYVEHDGHPNDDHGHGTHVTGTVAQATNNGLGVAGVADGVTIMPLKVLGADGSGLDSDVADAIRLAADYADVINLSLGSPYSSQTLEDALKYAVQNGVTVVCAAGNDGWLFDTPSYPAVYPECLAVAATTYQETRAFYSTYGSYIDLAAPGGVDNSLVPFIDPDVNNDGYIDAVLQQTINGDPSTFIYKFVAGTSVAAPHVSGLAALLLSHGAATGLSGSARVDEIRNIMTSTAEDLGAAGWDQEFGYGLIDAGAALAAVATQPPPDNLPPVAVVKDVEEIDSDGDGVETVLLDGTGSYDQNTDGSIVEYEWREGEVVLGYGKTLENTFALGTHAVMLVVTDDQGATGSDEGTVSVIAMTVETDQVDITKVRYDDRKQVLQVEATSSAQPQAQLTLYDDNGNSHEMGFDGRKYVFKGYVPVKPTAVTVESDLGGTDTTTLASAMPGGGKGKNK